MTTSFWATDASTLASAFRSRCSNGSHKRPNKAARESAPAKRFPMGEVDAAAGLGSFFQASNEIGSAGAL